MRVFLSHNLALFGEFFHKKSLYRSIIPKKTIISIVDIFIYLHMCANPLIKLATAFKMYPFAGSFVKSF